MFGLEGKAAIYVEAATGSLLIVAGGLVLMRIILGLTKKALTRSTLDGAMYKFVLNVLKAVLGVVLIVVLLGYLKVPTAPLITVLGAGGALTGFGGGLEVKRALLALEHKNTEREHP